MSMFRTKLRRVTYLLHAACLLATTPQLAAAQWDGVEDMIRNGTLGIVGGRTARGDTARFGFGLEKRQWVDNAVAGFARATFANGNLDGFLGVEVYPLRTGPANYGIALDWSYLNFADPNRDSGGIEWGVGFVSNVALGGSTGIGIGLMRRQDFFTKIVATDVFVRFFWF